MAQAAGLFVSASVSRYDAKFAAIGARRCRRHCDGRLDLFSGVAGVDNDQPDVHLNPGCQWALSLTRAKLGSGGILFVALGVTVNEEFRKQRAATVRAMAEKADPFTKKRLLDLADRYDRAPRQPTTIPSIAAELAQ